MLALVGVCIGLLAAFGPLAAYAIRSTATIGIVGGVPAGLGLLYPWGRSRA